MPTVDLPQGRVNYRVAGPPDSTLPPVVFVHGILVDGELWTGVADALAARGIRSYAPDLPLGAHEIAMNPDADMSPRGVARLVLAFIDALGLTDVTLVGNDTGGALCQFVLDTDASRVGRLVLTTCDAFDQVPPPPSFPSNLHGGCTALSTTHGSVEEPRDGTPRRSTDDDRSRHPPA